MFEFSIACKYLIPRRRQLSVSIISIISIIVIALVVSLIIVFFSITDGLEKNWIRKLTALTAPVRITPTPSYYQSYYYMIDGISEKGGYRNKTIREKQLSDSTNPYDDNYDQEIPSHWPVPHLNSEGTLVDPVKLAYEAVNEISTFEGLYAQDYELTSSHIFLNLLRDADTPSTFKYPGNIRSTLSYPAYLGNFESENGPMVHTLLPVEGKDIHNLFRLLGTATSIEDHPPEKTTKYSSEIFREQLNHFFELIHPRELITPSFGWQIPEHLYPQKANWNGYAASKDGKITHVYISSKRHEEAPFLNWLDDKQETLKPVTLIFSESNPLVIKSKDSAESTQALKTPLILAPNLSIKADLDPDSLHEAHSIYDLKFQVTFPVQNSILTGKISLSSLHIGTTDLSSGPFPWVHQPDPSSLNLHLPKDSHNGEGAVLPKSFREAGVLIGDKGYLTYTSATASILQEQRVPIYVAGFYDPGIIPIGGKFILVDPETTSIVRSSHQQEEHAFITNGINVRFDNIKQADEVKAKLVDAFQQRGISRYWTIETYREYEFTKEIIQELQNQKHIFMLIAIVIILVACSNIISMLIILVNDKKTEIGILQTMGATAKSIAFIFGLSGAIIGLLGSLLGLGMALLILSNLNSLIQVISQMQGHELFNASLYGKVLPHKVSSEALLFVLCATSLISLLAGIVPAIKASTLRPAQIFKSTGAG